MSCLLNRETRFTRRTFLNMYWHQCFTTKQIGEFQREEIFYCERSNHFSIVMVSFLPADTRNGARSTSEPADTYRSLLNCFYYAHLLKSDISETINARGPAHFAVTASLLHTKNVKDYWRKQNVCEGMKQLVLLLRKQRVMDCPGQASHYVCVSPAGPSSQR